MNRLFCVRLKEIRLEQGLTQAKLAKMLKCSVSKISKLEKCFISVKSRDLRDLPHTLNINCDYITGQTNYKTIFEKSMENLMKSFIENLVILL